MAELTKQDVREVVTEIVERSEDRIDGKITRLAATMDHRFEEFAVMVGKGFAAVDERFATVDERLGDVDGRLVTVDKRLATVDENLASVNKRLGRIEVQLQPDSFKHRPAFRELRQRVASLERKVSR